MGTASYRAAAALATVFVAGAATAQNTRPDIPYDLRDMVGARAGQAEGELGRRGYVNVGGQTGDDRSWTNWWNADRRVCVTIATRNGRYDSITTTPAPDCQRSDVAGNRPPAWGPGRPDSGRPDYGRPDYGRPDDTRPGWGGPNWGRGLTLVCYGGGTRPAAVNGWQYEWDSRERRYRPRYGTQLGSAGFTSEVQVQLAGGDGWIHLSGKMIPPINSRGRDGWWPLSNVMVGPDRITATYRLNGLNKPRLTIDRRSGRIDIQGMTKFSGSCDAGDWGRGRRF